MPPTPSIPAQRLAVLMPNWLGDAVMATPFLRALRALYPQAHIAALHIPLIAPVLAGLPFINETFEYTKPTHAAATRFLRHGCFDLAILLPNSFRAAWMAARARIPRRLGYAREGRSFLLTDSLAAPKRSLRSFRERVALAVYRNAAKGGEYDYRIGTGELVRVEPDAGFAFNYREVMRDRRTGESYTHGIIVPKLGHRLPVCRGYEPVPQIDYYLALAAHLGAPISKPPSPEDRRMILATTPEERAEALTLLTTLGLLTPPGTPTVKEGPPPPHQAAHQQPMTHDQEPMTPPSSVQSVSSVDHIGGGGEIVNRKSQIVNPLVLLVPGAHFGSSKCWPPDRFARLADYLMDSQGPFRATVLLASSPAERPLVDAILAASYLAPKGRLIALARLNDGRGVSLGALKPLIQAATLMVCNDTGPRHFAAALGTPVVTLFGPTDPVWAETFFDRERLVRVPVPCGPCQLKTCPIDHRCMNRLEVPAVLEKIEELWPPPAPCPRDADAAAYRAQSDLDPRAGEE